jgi:hypothetical protein
MELQEFISSVSKELEDPSINKQRKRYLESYIDDLLKYQKQNPSVKETPSHFQLFCSLNPDSLECRIYDD